MVKATELAKKIENIAKNYKTTYIWGGVGQPITKASIDQAVRQYSENNAYAPAARKLIGKNAFAFDCVGTIKSVLWGWTRRLDKEPRRCGLRIQWCS